MILLFSGNSQHISRFRCESGLEQITYLNFVFPDKQGSGGAYAAHNNEVQRQIADRIVLNSENPSFSVWHGFKSYGSLAPISLACVIGFRKYVTVKVSGDRRFEQFCSIFSRQKLK